MRLLITAACVLAGVVAVPAAAQAADAPCVRQNLSLLAGSWQRIDLLAADPSGRFQIGWGTDTSWHDHIIRWDGGVPADLGTPPGSIADVDQQGDFVGTTFDDQTYRGTAWRYSGGQVSILPGLAGGVETVARAIAPDGTVAGQARSADGRSTAVVWAPDNSIHALPATGSSQAIDIDADGTVIGTVDDAPVRWAPGSEPEALRLYQPQDSTYAELTAISGGTVLGTEFTGITGRVVTWAPDGNPVPVADGTGQAINVQGSIAYVRPYQNDLWLRQDGVDRPLPFGPSPYPVGRVVALTDTGVAYGQNFSTPVRWTCP
jgi:hypothetical protein